MFHPTAFPSPTGMETVRADSLTEVTAALDAASVTTSSLIIGPDDRIMVVVDNGMDFLAALVALDLDVVDTGGEARYARGYWRGLHIVIGFSGGAR